jgi:hypothetical protein
VPTAQPRYPGLVRPIDPSKICSVTAIVGDVAEAVRAAGGWMCDRVRAGWSVSALVPVASDPKPLQILGVRTTTFGAKLDESLLIPRPAALAIGIEALSLPNPIRAQIHALMRDPGIEVTIWGNGEFKPKQHFEHVQHPLSPAALAFKVQAMRAASVSMTIEPTEFFRSRASWYPLDHGIELDRVVRDSGARVNL